MNRYVLSRLLSAIPTLLGISFVIFAILSIAPNDPMSQLGTSAAVPFEVRENIKRSLGLDQPWPVRYFKWLWTLATEGDPGYSFNSRMPVTNLIMLRLPTTIWVLGSAYLISWLLAIPVGIIAAIKRYSLFDHVVTTFALVGFSIPTFLTGVLFILVFSVKLGWLPFIYDSTLIVKDWSSLVQLLKQSAMPILIVAFFQTAMMVRYVRASMLENLTMDYVRTARAKGIAEHLVIFRHVLRNSMIPVVTLIALGIPHIFGGALVTEQIFRVPGIGSLLVTSLQTSDTPVIMSINIVYAFLVVVSNLLADVVYGFLDPRIQYQ